MSVRVTRRFINNIKNNENGGFLNIPSQLMDTQHQKVSQISFIGTGSDRVVFDHLTMPIPAMRIARFDNRIKITNLPPNCTVSIYMMDGTLIPELIGPFQ